jgi:hypothetical protein
LALSRLAVAQGSTAIGSARATVVTANVVVSGLSDLDFGTVLGGAVTTVLPTDASAGSFLVTGNPNAFITMTFTLPTVLINTTGPPGTTMPITFGPTSARWLRQQNDPAAGNPFDPSIVTVGRLGPPPRPFTYLWLGGTVTPSPAQANGAATSEATSIGCGGGHMDHRHRPIATRRGGCIA